MSLLRGIQDAAIDPTVDLGSLLRKCKVLAARLGNEEFARWVEWELNGYPSKENLPAYRILKVGAYGHFVGAFGIEVKNAPIPPSCFPDTLRDFVSTAYVTQSVSALREFVEQKSSDMLHGLWPADIVALIRTSIYQDMTCLSAWHLITVSTLAAILDTVRNRVLSFVLEIEAQAPDAGEAPARSQPIPQDRVAQVFHTYIHAPVGNVAVGSIDFTQTAAVQVSPGDLASLRKSLAQFGVAATDLDILEQALGADATTEKPEGIGVQTGSWIGAMIRKASTGAWQVSASAAGGLLCRLIGQYLGLPG